MERRARVISTAVFAGLLTIVVGAGLTWACTGPTFGTPVSGSNPTSSAPEARTPATSGTPAPAQQTAPSPTNGLSTSGSGVTSGARTKTGTPTGTGTPTTGTRRVAPQTPVQNNVATRQFEQRADGATAGTTRSSGRAVFASPAAKPKASRSAKPKARSAPSARSASGDLWAGFEPKGRSSVFAAEASAAAEQGSSGPLTAALALLGLGLVGLIASATVLGLRRRKAEARATGSRSTE